MKYAISPEGVAGLRQLEADMNNINNQITDSGEKLKNVINSNEEGLGVYASDIRDIISNINRVQQNGQDSVTVLSGKIRQLAEVAESLIQF